MNKNLELRKYRKKQHINMFLKCIENNDNGFHNIILENNSLPEINFSDISTKCNFLNNLINYPIIINAMTGGFDEGFEINKCLAHLAKKFKIPIAVGSQTIAIQSTKCKSFKIVREIIEDGVVIANVSAKSPYRIVKKSIEMIDADAVQLHLNIPQEMCMKEGDRNFEGIINNIKTVLDNIQVPVIVKEVGFGISKKVANLLYNIGIRYIDIGGKGGTNFIQIEDQRNEDMDFSDFYSWGIPTALSLIQCNSISPKLKIIASGGISKADEIIKSLCLGSKVVGISGSILRILLEKGYRQTEKYLNDLMYKLKMLMLFVGCDNIYSLKNIEVINKSEFNKLS